MPELYANTLRRKDSDDQQDNWKQDERYDRVRAYIYNLEMCEEQLEKKKRMIKPGGGKTPKTTVNSSSGFSGVTSPRLNSIDSLESQQFSPSLVHR